MRLLLSQKQKIILITIGLSILIAFFVFSITNQSGKLKVVFFDIGQGSAIFIQTPNRVQVLIDGGPDQLLILERLSEKMPFWDRTIDLVISTHSSADHLTGLIEVLSRYQIDHFIWTGMETDSLTHQRFTQQLKNNQTIKVITAAQFGQKIKLEDGIYLEILNPFLNLQGLNPKNHNNHSIVVRLVFNEVSFLFTADIEKEREITLVKKQDLLENNFLEVDILKIPHHGSLTSSSLEFLRAVNPEIAVIQVGKNNRFGHPHQIIIDRLRQKEIDIYRTDIDGNIKIISDGIDFKITTSR